MSPDLLVSQIRREVVEANTLLYRQDYDSTLPADVEDAYSKDATSLYQSLGTNEREIFIKILRQTVVDTVSTILGVLDGVCVIGDPIEDFILVTESDPTKLNGNLQDIFIAHIAGMDVFARALLIANDILTKSDYKKMRTNRYTSFDGGEGQLFEKGKLKLQDLRKIAYRDGEPAQLSGKQELYEMILNQYI